MKLCPDPNEKPVVVYVPLSVCVDVQPGDKDLKRPAQLTQKVTVLRIPMPVCVCDCDCLSRRFILQHNMRRRCGRMHV